MFQKILIANRGEIVVRIIATCHEMGIQTVAIYSDADRYASHVRAADEAYFIGPAPAAQSYLRIDAILDIARRSKAQAIHPGYGFLSENAAFAEACAEAGIVFIGPPASALRLMASKIAAKKLAQSVGAPVVPGYSGEQQDEEFLLREAQRIGFPLLIKASAGGGGKGMREVWSAPTFLEGLEGAKREALASFGDAAVFLERLIQRPRHVEIQVLGDREGNLIHLGERECSIQRRHQKIVEESPSVALTPALRAAMGNAAVRIASAAGYSNAGTVEFILDEDRQFYFLEMNTRLQVEHPVTEGVLGVDLVRHQLLIADGQPLAISQEQISPRGHTIEVRIYAEDPERNFLPSTGVIQSFSEPRGPGIRVDSGVTSGDEITQYYDPMIAKLVVSAEDRPAAIARLRRALEDTAIFGVTTNVPLLHAITLHPAFQDGLTHTDFLQEYGFSGNEAPQESSLPPEVLLAAAMYDIAGEVKAKGGRATSGSYDRFNSQSAASANPWTSIGPWRMVGEARACAYQYQGKAHIVTLLPLTGAQFSSWCAQIDTLPAETIECEITQNMLILQRGALRLRTRVRRDKNATQVILNGRYYRLERRQPPDVESTAHSGGAIVQQQRTLTAPMAGTIVKVRVSEGEEVRAQQVLAILTAMKMEHAITAPQDGKVRRILAREGDVVKGGAIIVELE